jgi:stearoyl-CoA desaturase (delta-9 desaturase)
MENQASAPKPYAEIIPTTTKNWVTISFLFATPVLAVVLSILYVSAEGFALSDALAFFTLYLLTGMSITVGYHRYYTHRTFDCHPVMQFLMLVFGAASIQNSAIAWCSNHRYHHQFTDREGDPYDITRGFFYAHMGWMFHKDMPNRPYKNVPDLKKDKLVMWQYRWYPAIAIVAGFLLPMAIGALFGRPFGGLLWGGLVRMVISQQATFMINSVAHTIGHKTYSRSATARNNRLLALVSFGEGHHSFHHEFPNDYRIGVSWYDYDPAKWTIAAMSWLGITQNIKRTPPSQILRA